MADSFQTKGGKLKDKTAIVGIGETGYMRRSDKSLKQQVLEAVDKAIEDSGIERHEIDAIITENTIMPNSYPHSEMASDLGITCKFVCGTTGGMAGVLSSVLAGALAIDSGAANVVLSYFGTTWGSSMGGPYAYHDIYPAKQCFELPYGFYGQPVYFAAKARRAMYECGITEHQLASVAVNQRKHAIMNGNAQVMKPLSFEDYQVSPFIAEPLRIIDCCVVSDGAGAFIMTSSQRAKDCRKSPVYVMGVSYSSSGMSEDSVFTQMPDYLGNIAASRSTNAALKMAGITFDQIDFAELYDSFTITLICELASLGFVDKAEAGLFVEEGNTLVNGRLPVNTHGGMLSHGHVLGINHLIEAVRQLRSEAGATQVKNAKIGMVAGALLGHTTLILRNS